MQSTIDEIRSTIAFLNFSLSFFIVLILKKLRRIHKKTASFLKRFLFVLKILICLVRPVAAEAVAAAATPDLLHPDSMELQ